MDGELEMSITRQGAKRDDKHERGGKRQGTVCCVSHTVVSKVIQRTLSLSSVGRQEWRQRWKKKKERWWWEDKDYRDRERCITSRDSHDWESTRQSWPGVCLLWQKEKGKSRQEERGRKEFSLTCSLRSCSCCCNFCMSVVLTTSFCGHPCGCGGVLDVSTLHLLNADVSLGSGQRSRGVCPFLFLMCRSAPFDTRKHAMDALLFFSAPSVPNPISNWGVCEDVMY